MAAEDTIFKEALEAIEQGNRRQGRELLTRLIKANPKRADFWVWLSSVVDTRKECLYCLNEAIKLDPQNEDASRGLMMMGERPLDPKKIIPFRSLKSNWQKGYREQIAEKQPRQPFLRQAAGFAFVALLLVGFIGAGVIYLPSLLNPQYEIPNLMRGTATPSLMPSPAPGTPTATLPMATPLAQVLGLNYTPTPFYVYTPRSQYEAWDQAMEYFAVQDYANAIAFLQQVEDLDPNSPDIWYLIGEAYRLQGNHREANTAYTRAIQIDPLFAPSYLGRARIRLEDHASQWEQAQAEIAEVLRLDPNFGEAWLLMASSNITLHRYELADSQLGTAAELTPGSALVHLERARSWRLQEEFDLAIEEILIAQEIDQTILYPYRLLGELYQITGDMAASEEPLRIYITYVHDDAKPWAWLGMALAARRDWQGALGCYDQALALNPYYWEANALRGDVYFAVGLLDAAEEDYQAAIRFNPESFIANIGYGRVLFERGWWGNAYTQFNVADAYDTTPAERAAVHYWRALSLEELDQFSPAIRDWDALLALPPEALEEGWEDTARQHLESLRDATPTPGPTRTRTPTPSRTPTATGTAEDATPISQPATPTPR